MSSPKWFSQSMILAIAFTFCGGPQFAAAQQPAPQQNEQQQPAGQTTSSQQNVGTTQENATPDPSKGPLKPNEQTLPNAPSATQQEQQPTSQDPQQPTEAPLGAAAAQAAKTSGGAASRPAGTAIAPAKQHQTRSLLIKVGAIAAGAAAVGIVYGLSRGTSSVPPGANTATSASTAGTAQH
jgi:hypothetical protein